MFGHEWLGSEDGAGDEGSEKGDDKMLHEVLKRNDVDGAKGDAHHSPSRVNFVFTFLLNSTMEALRLLITWSLLRPALPLAAGMTVLHSLLSIKREASRMRGCSSGLTTMKPVLVSMNEIAGVYLAPEHFDFTIPADGVNVRMAYAKASSEGFESGVGHFIDVADRAVGDGSHAAEGAVNVAVHFTPEGADHARLVEILHDDNLWSRDASHVSPILVSGVRIHLAMGFVAWLNNDGDSIADHGSPFAA